MQVSFRHSSQNGCLIFIWQSTDKTTVLLLLSHQWIKHSSESTAPPAVGCSRRSSPRPPCGCRPPCTCGRPEAAHWSCTEWPGPETCCWSGWPGTPGSASFRSTSTSGWGQRAWYHLRVDDCCTGRQSWENYCQTEQVQSSLHTF